METANFIQPLPFNDHFSGEEVSRPMGWPQKVHIKFSQGSANATNNVFTLK